MSGVLTPLGVVSIGQALPGMGQLEALAALAQAQALAELSGKLAGALSVQVGLTIPPLPSVKVEGAAKVALQLALNPTIAAPSLQATANLKLIAELQAKIAALVLPDFGLGAAGVAAYRYEGDVSDLGARVSAATSGGLPGGSGSDQAFASLLVTTVPATAVALAKLVI